MDRHPNDLTTDEQIDRALEEARRAPELPRILEAAYRSEPGLDFLMLRLSDGRRLLVPREELSELKTATAEDASEIIIGPNGLDIYWPKLDDGLYLPDFLEHRWHRVSENVAA
jgi:hypothetical protein